MSERISLRDPTATIRKLWGIYKSRDLQMDIIYTNNVYQPTHTLFDSLDFNTTSISVLFIKLYLVIVEENADVTVEPH